MTREQLQTALDLRKRIDAMEWNMKWMEKRDTHSHIPEEIFARHTEEMRQVYLSLIEDLQKQLDAL